jgi:transposase
LDHLTMSTLVRKQNTTTDGFGRIEVMSGIGRRRWTDDQKAAIVAETLEPGARVCEVALRHKVAQSKVFAWRKEARERGSTMAALTPVVWTGMVRSERAMIEVEVDGIKLRIPSGAAAHTIQAVLAGLGALTRRR